MLTLSLWLTQKASSTIVELSTIVLELVWSLSTIPQDGLYLYWGISEPTEAQSDWKRTKTTSTDGSESIFLVTDHSPKTHLNLFLGNLGMFLNIFFYFEVLVRVPFRHQNISRGLVLHQIKSNELLVPRNQNLTAVRKLVILESVEWLLNRFKFPQFVFCIPSLSLGPQNLSSSCLATKGAGRLGWLCVGLVHVKLGLISMGPHWASSSVGPHARPFTTA